MNLAGIIFSRIIYGSRTALQIGFISAIVGATLGLGAWCDQRLSRRMV